jgi:hypothetical protein
LKANFAHLPVILPDRSECNLGDQSDQDSVIKQSGLLGILHQNARKGCGMRAFAWLSSVSVSRIGPRRGNSGALSPTGQFRRLVFGRRGIHYCVRNRELPLAQHASKYPEHRWPKIVAFHSFPESQHWGL